MPDGIVSTPRTVTDLSQQPVPPPPSSLEQPLPPTRTKNMNPPNWGTMHGPPNVPNTNSNFPPPHMQEVKICINDMTVDCTDDNYINIQSSSMITKDGADDDDDNLDLIEQIKRANKRRSSWCPEEGRKKEEKQEKQKMLNVTGRR